MAGNNEQPQNPKQPTEPSLVHDVANGGSALKPGSLKSKGKLSTKEQGSGAGDEPVKMGRPTDFTDELGEAICAELAEGKSLRTVCLAETMPDKATVFRWLRVHDDFRDQYARAKEEAADAMAEELLDIADDGTNDYMTITRGDQEYEVENKEVLARSRLRVDTRKFLMAKMKPKRYGEKLDISGEQTFNHKFKDLDDEQLDARLNAAIKGRKDPSA